MFKCYVMILTWIDGVTYTASNTSATYTIPVCYRIQGCDSVVTLDLTVIHR